jgi:hypothetical protein
MGWNDLDRMVKWREAAANVSEYGTGAVLACQKTAWL